METRHYGNLGVRWRGGGHKVGREGVCGNVGERKKAMLLIGLWGEMGNGRPGK